MHLVPHRYHRSRSWLPVFCIVINYWRFAVLIIAVDTHRHYLALQQTNAKQNETPGVESLIETDFDFAPITISGDDL